MRRTFVCSLCGNQVVLHVEPSVPPTCSNRKHREVREMKEVGDPAGVARRARHALADVVNNAPTFSGATGGIP